MSKENVVYIDFALGEVVESEAAMRISAEQEAAQRQRDRIVADNEPMGVDLDMFVIHLAELRRLSNVACEHGALHERLQTQMHKVMKDFSSAQRELAWGVVQRHLGERILRAV